MSELFNFKEIVVQVVESLSATWKFNFLSKNDYGNRFEILGERGRRFYVHADRYGYAGKFHICGNRHSINVSYKRDPRAIARDIERRFLPEYLHLAEAAERQNVEKLAKQERFSHIKNMFLGLLPGSVDGNSSDPLRMDVIKRSGYIGKTYNINRARVETSSYDATRCTISLDLSTDDAIKTVVFINNLGLFDE